MKYHCHKTGFKDIVKPHISFSTIKLGTMKWSSSKRLFYTRSKVYGLTTDEQNSRFALYTVLNPL